MDSLRQMGVRRFGRWNTRGLYELIRREVVRFLSVWTQTLLAPLVTATLFLFIFALAIGPTRGDVMGVPFLHFLAPGLLTMTVITNSFANTSSSLMAAKVQGNIVDSLMPPLSPAELVIGFVAGGLARGLFVALTTGTIMIVALGIPAANPLISLLFAALGATFMAGLGIIAAILADKFDHMAAITNFIVTPLAFLSGTFYSIDGMPLWLQAITRFNPVFYMIDGVRFGIIGRSDTSPILGLAVCSLTCIAVLALAWHWFRTGYKLKS